MIVFDKVFTKYIVLKNETTNYYKLYRLVHETHNEEIPILGSSTVLRGYLPDTLGSNFYNYGITASNFQKVEFQLKVELAKDKNTPIIIDLPPPFFYDKDQPNIRIEDFLPIVDISEVSQFMNEYDYAQPWHHLPGIRYFGYYLTYVGAYYREGKMPKRMGVDKGAKFVRTRQTAQEFERLAQWRKENPIPIQISEKMVERFKNLVKSHPNRQIVLVVSPFHKAAYESGTDLKVYINLIQRLENDLPNIKGLVFDGTNYPDDYFLDTSHLNYWGAVYFSKELRRVLIQEGVITN